MTITPDTKNWTWVLEKRCAECGFDPEGLSLRDVPRRLEAVVASWPAVLERIDADERPDDRTWSPLEYAAHVRDVFRVGEGRFRLMLEEDGAVFADWDQDATAVDDDYAHQDPATVTVELAAAGESVVRILETVPDDARGRGAVRSDGSAFTVESFAVYLLHDVEHHVHDVSP